jgi:hypothetical protein
MRVSLTRQLRGSRGAGSLVAVDFFVVATAMFKGLFVFVVLAHHRRRVVQST